MQKRKLDYVLTAKVVLAVAAARLLMAVWPR